MSQKVLCVGKVCLDTIHDCYDYPEEDSEQRSKECYLQRGGNASNSCTVLSLLGTPCEFLGTIANDHLFWKFIKNDFEKYKIDYSHCVGHPNCDLPLSSILINSKNGSRTIVHADKNLPYLLFEEFDELDLKNYSWIHFSGRNLKQVSKMMAKIEDFNKMNSGTGIVISFEIEKDQAGILDVLSPVDVLFLGKLFCRSKKWNGMKETLVNIKPRLKNGAICLVAWGEKGAMASVGDVFYTGPSYPPAQMVDSLGAGDTFVAAVIHALSRSAPLQHAVDFGCLVAGTKIGSRGYDGVKGMDSQVKFN